MTILCTKYSVKIRLCAETGMSQDRKKTSVSTPAAEP